MRNPAKTCVQMGRYTIQCFDCTPEVGKTPQRLSQSRLDQVNQSGDNSRAKKQRQCWSIQERRNMRLREIMDEMIWKWQRQNAEAESTGQQQETQATSHQSIPSAGAPRQRQEAPRPPTPPPSKRSKQTTGQEHCQAQEIAAMVKIEACQYAAGVTTGQKQSGVEDPHRGEQQSASSQDRCHQQEIAAMLMTEACQHAASTPKPPLQRQQAPPKGQQKQSGPIAEQKSTIHPETHAQNGEVETCPDMDKRVSGPYLTNLFYELGLDPTMSHAVSSRLRFTFSGVQHRVEDALQEICNRKTQATQDCDQAKVDYIQRLLDLMHNFFNSKVSMPIEQASAMGTEDILKIEDCLHEVQMLIIYGLMIGSTVYVDILHEPYHMTVRTVTGTFIEQGTHNGRSFYKRIDQNNIPPDSPEAFLYYFDDWSAFPVHRGWWIGEEIDGHEAFAFFPDYAGTWWNPPARGWHIPWDSDVQPFLSILDGASTGYAITWHKSPDMTAHRIKGTYSKQGTHHGQTVYKMVNQNNIPGDCLERFLYYYDDSCGAAYKGWWFGPEINGVEVMAFNPDGSDSWNPPTAGWKIPWDGDVHPHLSILVGGNPQLQAKFLEEFKKAPLMQDHCAVSQPEASFSEAYYAAFGKQASKQAGQTDANHQKLRPISQRLIVKDMLESLVQDGWAQLQPLRGQNVAELCLIHTSRA